MRYLRISTVLLLVFLLTSVFFEVKPVRAALNPDTSTLLEGFEDNPVAPTWTVNAAYGYAAANTTTFKQGTQGITLSTNNATSGTYITKTVNWDVSTIQNVRFWIYVVDYTQIQTIYVYLADSADFSKYHSQSISNAYGYLVNGWNLITMAKSKFGTTGASNWASAVIRFRVKVDCKTTGTFATVVYDDFRLNYNRGARILIMFDDGYSSVLDKAYPIMVANGQSGTMFISTSQTGGVGRMTEANLSTLYNLGWDISDHTHNHTTLTTDDAATLADETSYQYNNLVSLGFYRSAGLLAYPGGAFNTNVIASTARYHAIGRTIISSAYAGHPTLDGLQEYQLKTWTCSNTTTVASIENEIDYVVERSGLLALLFHNIVDANADVDTKYLTANFQLISDYIKTKTDAGTVVVETLSQYYGEIGTKPTITTNSATSVVMNGGSKATLQGTISSLGTSPTNIIWFEWGYNTGYGHTVDLQSTILTGNYSYDLTKYNPDWPVHYRFVSESPAGITYGSDVSFAVVPTPVYSMNILMIIVLYACGILLLIVIFKEAPVMLALVFGAVLIYLTLAFVTSLTQSLSMLW